jgi:hypothetical protein
VNVRATRVAERHQRHWDGVYQNDPGQLSWYQPNAALSIELMAALEVPTDAAVIDVGGGASTLVDQLHAGGFTDVSVLDVSQLALDIARRRLGTASNVHWLHEDLLAWEPTRRYDLWHDRAAFHFLVDEPDRARYRHLLRTALAPGGAVVIGTFGPSGPVHCSGLPVAGYGPDELQAELGDGFTLAAGRLEEHTTPSGATQQFTWLALRTNADQPGRRQERTTK